MSTVITAALRSPVLIALLSVLVSGCTESTVVPESATLGITTSTDSIPSDGLASVVVTAELPRALVAGRTVVVVDVLRATTTLPPTESVVSAQRKEPMWDIDDPSRKASEVSSSSVAAARLDSNIEPEAKAETWRRIDAGLTATTR